MRKSIETCMSLSHLDELIEKNEEKIRDLQLENEEARLRREQLRNLAVQQISWIPIKNDLRVVE